MSDTLFAAKATKIVSTWLQAVNDRLYGGKNPIYVTTGGSANAYTLTLPATSLYAAYAAGDTFTFKASFTNTGAATLSVIGASALAAKSVTLNGTALVGGEIVANLIYSVVYEDATGTFQLRNSALVRANISSDTAVSCLYRSDAVFNGTTDHGTILGYNTTGFGQIADASKSSIMVMLEPDYNDGSVHQAEYHVDMAIPGGQFIRPFAASIALTGGNAGSLLNVDITSQVNLTLRSPNYLFEAAAVYTTGAIVHLQSLDVGGKDWIIGSTGSGAGKGAGHLIVYDNTSGKYRLVLDTNGNIVLGDAAIATNATDGFLYIPTCAGAPVGTPTAQTGRSPIVYDTTDNKLYIYNGAWKSATFA